MKETKTNLSKCLAISIVYMNSMNPHLYGSQPVEDFSDDKKGFSQKRNIDTPNFLSHVTNFDQSKKTIKISHSPVSRTGNTFDPQTRNIDMEVPPPPLVSGSRLMEEENVRKDRSSERDEHYPKIVSQKKEQDGFSDYDNVSSSSQIKKSQEKDIPKTKTQSLSLEKEKKGSRKEYPGETPLPKKEKQEKHVSHKNGKQENIREFNSEESQESDVVEIDGFLDSNKKALLKKHSHLSLYGIRPTEKVKHSAYFEKDSLIISPETINLDVISIRLKLCRIRDHNIEHIGDFKKLKKLELPTNQITDVGVSYITKLSQLETLDLTRNCITDKGVKEIAQMPLLTTLNLSSNKGVTDEGIDFLKGHHTLKKLIIEITSVSENKYDEISKWKLKELVYYPSK